MRNWVRHRPFLAYYLLACTIALGVIAASALMAAFNPGVMRVVPEFQEWLAREHRYSNVLSLLGFAFGAGRWPALLILLFAAAPTLAAWAVSWAQGGRPAVVAWLGRLKPWGSAAARGAAAQVYAALAVVYLGVLAWLLWLTLTQGTPELVSHTRAMFGGSVIAALGVVLLGAFIDEGGTLEELGWRAFALPWLQARWSPLSAAVVLGLLWWAWHLPREIPLLLGGVAIGPWLAGQGVFALLTVALSVVMAFCVNRTGGSVLPAILIHGGTNVWSKAASAQAAASFDTDVRTWIVLACALGVAGLAGRRLGLADTSPPSGRGSARGTAVRNLGRPGRSQPSP